MESSVGCVKEWGLRAPHQQHQHARLSNQTLQPPQPATTTGHTTILTTIHYYTTSSDMLTDDGSVAVPLDFEASVPLAGLANLSLALTWFNISGIDSFNGLSILEPLDPYSLATSLDLGYLNMTLGVTLKVIPTGDTVEDFVLVEHFNIVARLKDVSLDAILFLAMDQDKLDMLYVHVQTFVTLNEYCSGRHR